MEALELVRFNLLSPIVLAFVLGIVATLIRSDLKFPDELYTALSIFLLLAIGMKGGAALSETPIEAFWRPALATLGLGLAIPVVTYVIVRRLGRFSIADSAAMAAHYGSVSAVTFIACVTFLESARVPYEGFMPTLVAILEVPAIVVALLIARYQIGGRGTIGEVLHEVLAGKSIVLLLGGLTIGFLAGRPGLAPVEPFFIDLFHGALTLFLLEMGMVAARRFRDLKKVGIFLIAFGVIMPVVYGTIGVWLGLMTGLTMGGATVLAVLAGSASYIAAPAAVRIALPEANPGYYLTGALAITFPFNLTIGIPLYHAIAQWVYA
jgi:uncharacterized protein